MGANLKKKKKKKKLARVDVGNVSKKVKNMEGILLEAFFLVGF